MPKRPVKCQYFDFHFQSLNFNRLRQYDESCHDYGLVGGAGEFLLNRRGDDEDFSEGSNEKRVGGQERGGRSPGRDA